MRRLLQILAALGISAIPALAQIQPIAVPMFQWTDTNGAFLAGGKVCSYAAGTSTPQATYSDSLGTLNTNPIILDSVGRAVIWFGNQSYKLIVLTPGTDNTCSTGSVVWSQDNIPGAGQSVASNAFSAITAATNSHAGSFAMSGNTLDLSAATLVVPHQAGAAPTVSARIGYDDTANDWVFGQNGSTVKFGLSSSACAGSNWVNTPATATAAATCTQPAFTDISGTIAAGQIPSGLAMTSPHLTTPQIGGMTITNVPWIVWGGAFPFTSINTSNTNAVSLMNTAGGAITIKEVDFAMTTSMSGCAGNPVLTVYDETAASDLNTITLSNGTATYTHTGLSISVAANHVLDFHQKSGTSGCSFPTIGSFSIQYQMQ